MNYYPVIYTWIVDGVINRGHSVASGKSQEDAERSFQRQNKHVTVVRR